MKHLSIIFALILISGCSTTNNTKEAKLLVGASFTSGSYSDLLRETFGEKAIYSGTNFFVLSNPWAPTEPNGLSIGTKRVQYVEKVNGKLNKYDILISNCTLLANAVHEFNKVLLDSFLYANGEYKYQNPPYLDGPDYIIEYHGNNSNIIIDPIGFSGNFPAVVAAENIIAELKTCNAS